MKWFKHDSDANQDAKLQNVMLDYGLEGYGLYWYCIELIAGRVDKDSFTFELEHDARIIARNTGSTPQKVEEMMRYFVKIGLFENSDGVITCLKMARRLDKSMTSNTQMREIIDKIKNHDIVMTPSEKVMKDEKRIEEKRVDKEKKQRIKDAFDEFWSSYHLKKNKSTAERAFNSAVKREKIKDLQEFVSMLVKDCKTRIAAGEFGFDRLHASTYLNNNRWEDSVSLPESQNKTENSISSGFYDGYRIR